MSNDLDELTRVVGTMPREMVREVLNFARYLQRQRTRQESADWDDDFGSRLTDGAFASYHPWDAADGPAMTDAA